MVLQWATKRLLKFLLKRLNRFLYDEIDVEQLDVQLGSGIGELRELILNAEYITDQLKGLPVILKSGCITRIVVRLPCEIEVDGLELTVAPCQPGDQLGAEFRPTSTSSEDVDVDGSTNGYSGVSDGVRVVGQIIKSWLLGLRVKLTGVSIRVEGGDDHLTLSIPSLEYGYEDSKEDNGDVEKVLKLTNVNVEAGDQQVGLFGEKGVTSRIRIGVFGGRTTPKIALDVGVESACFRASVENMKQLVSVTSAFMNGNMREENGSVYHDTCSFYDPGLKSVMVDTPRCSLPIISYWMRKPELSEPELDASMDEFFECLDQTAANSGLWQWTCTALGAASTSGTTSLTPEAIHVEYSINARLKSLSAMLLYDESGEGLELVVKDVNASFSQELKVHIHDIEVNQLQPSTSQRECFTRLAQTVFSRSFVQQELSEDLQRKKVQLLKVSSSSEEPAVVMLSKNRGTRKNFSVSFQPLVVWFDDGVLEKMAAFLARLHVSSPSHPTDAGETVEENNRMLEVRLPAIKAFLSAARKCRAIVAVHLEAASAIRQGKRKELIFSVAEGFVDVICGPSPLRVLSLFGRASCELKWTDHNNTSPSVAKKLWDSIAVQAKSSPGSANADFAWATNLRADTRHSVLDMLKATSALRVNVLLSTVGLDLSTPDHVAALELLSQFGASSSDSGVSHSDNDFASQTVILLSARVAVVVSNTLRLRVTNLKITTALALGGDASASFFQVSHGDGCLTEGDSEVLSCKGTVIGRGDGGCSNVLSTGSAGLSLTVVSWPGREQLADCLVTGHMNGGTLVTEGGEFGWLPAVMNFFDQCGAPFQKSSDEPPAESSSRTYFHFDLHDVALRYEPSVDTQVPSSIGCVLAASSFRVSSGEGAEAGISCYYIASRELGLQLVDRKLRQFVDDAKSLQREGYVKVAGAPVLSATVKIDSKRLPSWVLESFDNQLQFDSCSDTTAAFGQLVSDIQRLFAPEIPETDEVSQVSMKVREAESVQAEEEFEDADTEDANELFKGLVENAFTVCKRTTASCSTSQTVIQHEVIEQSDSPVIEDYYFLEKLSKARERRYERPGGINDSEATGGWYEASSLDVMDSHVPVGRGRISKKASSTSLSQPQPTGKVLLTGWKITWKLYEGTDWQSKRSSAKCVEVSVSGLDLQYDSFAPTGLFASSLILEVHDVRVYDCGENAPWKLILGYYDKVSRPRESSSKAVRFRMDTVRPNPSSGLEEYRISLAILPIRVHLDQDHVDFFTQFFSSDNDVEEVACVVNNAMLPFFQVCEMRGLVIRVDYVPRRLNFGSLREGNLVELLNLCSWKGVELQLNPVHTSGVYGWSSLTGLILGQWLEEISVHQIPLYLKCAAPIRPMCAIGSGAAKLFILPAKQYKKDKRFFKGIRKGAIAFVQSLSLEALGFGANLAGGAHHILSQTEVALGGEKRDAKRKKPPSGPCEGLKQAYESLTQGLEKTAVSLVSNPVKAYQRGEGAGVAVASAIRASPTAILAPASAAAQAVRHTLLGVRNGLDPERRRERADDRRR